jgi:hypothetical protein
MVRHTILFKLKQGVSKREVENIFSELLSLTHDLTGVEAIMGGTCYFHEETNSNMFSHGFSIDFRDSEARALFLANPMTWPIKDKIIDVAEKGMQGVIGFDFKS